MAEKDLKPARMALVASTMPYLLPFRKIYVLLFRDHNNERKPQMRDFQGKVAVITGGSNGIGYAIAEQSLKEGMKVVIASFGTDSLAKAEARLRLLYPDAQLLTVRTDVSKATEVEELAGGSLLLIYLPGLPGLPGPTPERWRD